MGVDAAAVTPAEAAHYRAAGWWTDTTLSKRVTHNAGSTPDKPAYIDCIPDGQDRVLTWLDFDHAATNLAHRLCALGVAPGTGVVFWHKDTAEIHALLVAIERCGAVAIGIGARAGIREVTAILRTTRPSVVVADTDRLAPAQRAADDADPRLRVVSLDINITAPPDGTGPLVCRNALCTTRIDGPTSTRRP
ncbi:AMP-binding protein [Mycobacterium sp. ACS1612]|uniref:AMP-binding protein n=1 Tax=Mycobacterium sp. ACS1612 TaxID=1834117 RepID=UPI002100F195|nr:AMP-binding protein [Mycobacterium sp. ACS1612]